MGVVSVHRVRGPGSEDEMSITFEGERLCGNGRFSNVYSASLTSPTSMRVAVKNIWEEKDHPPIVGLHPEISILSQLDHPNIISLLYHYVRTIENEKLHCLVLEYLPEDVQKLRDKGIRFDLLDAKLYSYQLLCAAEFLAEKSTIHLDIKPANMLIDHNFGILKLADFGNAQILVPGKDLEQQQPYQVTRYYRAPELVFSTKYFTTAIDTWSVACCLYDFITGRVLFKGKSASDQMKLLLDAFGYPTEEEIKAMRISRPRCGRPSPKGVEKFVGSDFPKAVLEILKAVFVYNPKKRMTPSECLKSPFFDAIRANPAPTRWNGGALPSFIKGDKKKKDEEDEEDK